MRVCMMIPTHTAYKNYPEPVEEGFYLSIPENPNLLVLRPDWYAGWPINQAEWLDDFVTLFYRDAHLHATNPTFTHDFIQTIPVLVIEAKIHEQFNNALAQKRFSSKSESEKCEIMRKKRHHARRMEVCCQYHNRVPSMMILSQVCPCIEIHGKKCLEK